MATRPIPHRFNTLSEWYLAAIKDLQKEADGHQQMADNVVIDTSRPQIEVLAKMATIANFLSFKQRCLDQR
jgi:hypothetical protein